MSKSLKRSIRGEAERGVPHDKSTKNNIEPIFKTSDHQIAAAIRVFDSKIEVHHHYVFMMLIESFNAMGNKFCAIDEEGNCFAFMLFILRKPPCYR